MRFILSLSVKNLFRYKRRTVITAASIAAGISIFLFMDAWLSGVEKESVRNLVKYETGSARIMDSRYWDEHDYLLPKYNLADPIAITKTVAAAGYLSTMRITVLAEIVGENGNHGVFQCILAGIDPATDDQVFALRNAVAAGNAGVAPRYPAAGSREILLGRDLADNLGIVVGSAVMVKTKTAGGQFTTMDAIVTGLLETPDPIVNAGMIFMPISYVQDSLQMAGKVTDVIVTFPEYADVKTETQKLASLVAGNVVVKNYLDIASEYLSISQTHRGESLILLFMIFIIAGIGISNTMLLAVFERTREIGMMRALGMRSGAILLCLIIEAIGIGFIGGLGGALLSLLVNLYMVNVGIDFSFMMKDVGNMGWRTLGMMHSAWNFDSILWTFAGGVIFSGIMALFPGSLALRRGIINNLANK